MTTLNQLIAAGEQLFENPEQETAVNVSRRIRSLSARDLMLLNSIFKQAANWFDDNKSRSGTSLITACRLLRTILPYKPVGTKLYRGTGHIKGLSPKAPVVRGKLKTGPLELQSWTNSLQVALVFAQDPDLPPGWILLNLDSTAVEYGNTSWLLKAAAQLKRELVALRKELNRAEDDGYSRNHVPAEKTEAIDQIDERLAAVDACLEGGMNYLIELAEDTISEKEVFLYFRNKEAHVLAILEERLPDFRRYLR